MPVEYDRVSQPAKTRNRHVLLLADDLTKEGGIRSRVFGEASVARRYVDLDIIVKTRAVNLRLSEETRRKTKHDFPEAELSYIPSLPHHGLPLLKEFFFIANVLMLIVGGLFRICAKRPCAIYAHNLECSIAAEVLGHVAQLPVTCDFHGDEIEEASAELGWPENGFRIRFWRHVMMAVISRSAYVVCVSNMHRLHFETAYGRKKATTVIPCCTDILPSGGGDIPRSTGRSSLKKHRVELLYSGSASRYQLIEKMIQFNSSLNDSGVQSLLRLLISDPDSIEEVKKKAGGPYGRLTNALSVAHNDVASFGSKADFGLLFRGNEIFNRISSPTKFAEYMAMGLPVLITPCVGDYSAAVRTEKLGGTIDLERIHESGYAKSIIQPLLEDTEIRNRCRSFAESHLTWKAHEADVLKAFHAFQ
jgi:glycosyltransferase involved in cell wall biosynthesis